MNVNEIREITQNKTAVISSNSGLSAVDSFETTLQAAGSKTCSLDDIFNNAAKKYNVDVNLLKAIAKQESNFQTDVVSGAGAQGVMQLMPATAKAMGVTDAMDPEQNIMGGAKLISQLLKQYDGDVKLALAGYNAGTGNVAKYNGIPPFTETQNYVKKVMAYYQNGVDVPDTALVSSSTSGSDESKLYAALVNDGTTPVKSEPDAALLADTGDSIFSYQDYMKFLDIFMKLMESDSQLFIIK